MKRKILAQGDRDGACFLYSIANCYFALTMKELTAKKWGNAINAIPFKIEEFLSGKGTEKLNDKLVYFEGFCQNFLDSTDISFKVTQDRSVSENSLRTHIKNNQVVIAAIDNGNHWVNIVDSDKEFFYIACSAEALESLLTYKEEQSTKFSRTYNAKLSFSDLKLWNNFALLINIPNAIKGRKT